METAQEMISGAEFSEDGKYRYRLWRIWDGTLPKILFVMHNPSTADQYEDDPTIRRCIAFAKSWGFGGLYVANLYPYVSTDKSALKGLDWDTLAPSENAKHISELLELCHTRVLAYGNKLGLGFPIWLYSVANWHCIKLNADGTPAHPLYLPSESELIPFESWRDQWDANK